MITNLYHLVFFNQNISLGTLKHNQSNRNVQHAIINRQKHRAPLHNYPPLSKMRNYISIGLTSLCHTWLLDGEICSAQT